LTGNEWATIGRILDLAEILSRGNFPLDFPLEIRLGFLNRVDDFCLKCCILGENPQNSISGRKREVPSEFLDELFGMLGGVTASNIVIPLLSRTHFGHRRLKISL